MNKRGHFISPEEFCYICAKFIFGQKRSFNDSLQSLYWKYFKSNCSDLKKDFTPSFICSTCYRYLYQFKKDNSFKFPFTFPAIWTEATSHGDGDCYFCSIKRPRFKRRAEFFDCSSCKIPKSIHPEVATRTTEEIESSSSVDIFSDSSLSCNDVETFQWSMDTFNDFYRELNLSRRQSKKCVQMLRKDPDLKRKMTNVTMSKIDSSNISFLSAFSTSGSYSFCNSIESLFQTLGINYNSQEWCLFIDSSSVGLKAALMFNEHKYPTIPIAYGQVKESRESL